MRHLYGIGLILISATAFGTMAIFARIAYAAGADPLSVLFLRFALAASMLALLLRARKLAFPRRRVLRNLILMGSIGYVGQSLAYFTALTLALPA